MHAAYFAIFTLGLVASKKLLIYHNLAEIKEPLNPTGIYEFSEKEFNNVIKDTVSVSGLNAHYYIIGTSRVSNAENEIVYFLDPSCSSGDYVRLRPCSYLKGILIDADRNIVQGIDSQRFFYVPLHNLQYTNIPDHNRGIFKVFFNETIKGNEYLSYYTRALKWNTEHVMDVSTTSQPQQRVLVSFALIHNSNDVTLKAEGFRLIGTDLNLGSSPMPVPYMKAASVAAFDGGFGGEASPILSEALSILQYDYPSTTISIPPKSFLKVILVQTRAIVFRFGSLNLYSGEGVQKGNFDKIITLTLSQSVPAGNLLIRENGVTLATSNLDQMVEGKETDLNLGTEPTLAYTVETTYKDLDKEGINKQVRSIFIIKNFATHDQNVKITVIPPRGTISKVNLESVLRLEEESQMKLVLSGNIQRLNKQKIVLNYLLTFPIPLKPNRYFRKSVA